MWQENKIRAQERKRLNDTPHILSRGGYALLEEKWKNLVHNL